MLSGSSRRRWGVNMLINFGGDQRCPATQLAAGAGAGYEQGQVLNALGWAPDKLRSNSGESLASVFRSLTKPLQEVTTSSLEALEAFIKAGMSYAKEAMRLLPSCAVPARHRASTQLLPWRMPLGQPVLTRWPGRPRPPEFQRRSIERARREREKF